MPGQIFHGIAFNPVCVQLFHTRNEVHNEDLQRQNAKQMFKQERTWFSTDYQKMTYVPIRVQGLKIRFIQFTHLRSLLVQQIFMDILPMLGTVLGPKGSQEA